MEEKFENAINFEFIESRKGLYVCGMTDYGSLCFEVQGKDRYECYYKAIREAWGREMIKISILMLVLGFYTSVCEASGPSDLMIREKISRTLDRISLTLDKLLHAQKEMMEYQVGRVREGEVKAKQAEREGEIKEMQAESGLHLNQREAVVKAKQAEIKEMQAESDLHLKQNMQKLRMPTAAATWYWNKMKDRKTGQ